jgi:hypothetical protein
VVDRSIDVPELVYETENDVLVVELNVGILAAGLSGIHTVLDGFFGGGPVRGFSAGFLVTTGFWAGGATLVGAEGGSDVDASSL